MLRLFHTSDWHLGQQFFGHGREFEHQAFLDWLLQRCAQEQPDLLVIAGDVFDTANPPIEAQSMLYRFLIGLHGQCPEMQVVMIAGNHDSGHRIELPQPLLEALHVHAVGRVLYREGEMDLDRLLIPVQRKGQRLGWCLALPYLRPAEVTRHGLSPMQAYEQLYHQVLEAAQRQCGGEPLVLVHHAHVQGGSVSEHSERNLIIGAVEAIPLAWLQGADYVALGHLHKAHPLGQPQVRYSGSPLPLSMAEQSYVHQVLDVRVQPGQPVEVHRLDIPRPLAMHRLGDREPCGLEQIITACAQLPALDLPVAQHDWLDITLTLSGPPPADLRQQLQHALAGKSVRLVRYQIRSALASRDAQSSASVLGELPTPKDLFLQLWQRAYPDSDPTHNPQIEQDFDQLIELAQQQQESCQS